MRGNSGNVKMIRTGNAQPREIQKCESTDIAELARLLHELVMYLH